MPSGGSGTSPSVRSTTATSPSPPRTTSCPAARSAPSTFEPNSRSGLTSPTRATALLHPAAAELLAHRLRPPPHLHHLDPPGARLAHGQLALDPEAVEQRQRPAHGLGSGRVPELARHAQAPVPVVLGVRHRVDLRQERGRLDVAVLVGDPHVELEVGPVGRERVHDRLEVVGERHLPERYPPTGTTRIARVSRSPSACSRPFASTVSGPPNGSRPASTSSSPGAMPSSER